MKRFTSRVTFIALLMALLLATVAPAFANVSLLYFRVDPVTGSANKTVSWATETETDTAAFRVYRGATDNWEQAGLLHTEPSRGNATQGFEYTYTDTTAQAGQAYHYFLVEVQNTGGMDDIGHVELTASGATTVPTATTAPTATSQATATTAPTATPVTQAAATTAPTATPVTQAAATPAPTATPVTQPTATPAAVATAPNAAATTAAAVQNTPVAVDTPVSTVDTPVTDNQTQVVDTAATEAAVKSGEQAPVTDAAATQSVAENAAQAPAVAATTAASAQAATPQAVAESSQSGLVRPTATPRATGSSGSGDSSNMLLILGGGSLCGAALLGLVVFFVWRRGQS